MARKRSTPVGSSSGGLPVRWAVGLIAVVAVAVGLLALFAQLGSTPERAAASVEVDPGAPGGLAAASPAIDLGRVPFNKEVVADFELVNTGGTAVKLTSAPTVAMLEGC
jgi:hypothetical protein